MYFQLVASTYYKHSHVDLTCMFDLTCHVDSTALLYACDSYMVSTCPASPTTNRVSQCHCVAKGGRGEVYEPVSYIAYIGAPACSWLIHIMVSLCTLPAYVGLPVSELGVEFNVWLLSQLSRVHQSSHVVHSE